MVGVFILILKKYIFYPIAIFLILAICFILYQYCHTTRYAVFAGYNKDGVIEPYVITYLKGLNEVTDGIVYITDSSLKPEELKKLKSINIIHNEHIRHKEYDWGSYKRGYTWLRINGYLEKADELILANDSCYAPLSSFKPMFKEMQKRKDLDFWSDLQSTKFTPHLQSYFYVFRKPVLNSKLLDVFLRTVKHQKYHFNYIFSYELKLTSYLENFGFKRDSYMPYKKLSYLEKPEKNSYPLTLIKDYNHQFLKRRTFTELLEINEDIPELLDYLKQNHPQTYSDIKSAKHPRFIEYFKDN